jgi:cytochrome c oxidase cbb3-type subunit 3
MKIHTAVVFVLSLTATFANASGDESGADLYRTYCAQCHGVKGDGMGINIRDMSVQPRDHTDATAMSARSDELLFKAVKEGGQSINKSVLMPPWDGVLSDDEIHRLIEFMRELCQCRYGAG